MKLFASAAVAALIVASASAAQAGDTYVQLDAGIVAAGQTDMTVNVGGFGSVDVDADVELGYLLSGAWGKELDNGLAVEGEMLIAGAGLDADLLGSADASVGTVLIMANAKYAFNKGEAWQPYVGAGAGFGQVRYEVEDGASDNHGFAWQLRAGVMHTDATGRTWDVGYRYVSTPDFEESDGGDSLTAETSFHAISVGMRF